MTNNEDSIKKLGIDDAAETRIMDYVDVVYNEYAEPLGGIKEIPLNLKGKEIYFAIFYFGSLYTETYFSMKEKEMATFLSYLVEGLGVSDDAIDYVTTNIIATENEMQFSVNDIIKIIDSKFTEKEKYYMLFSYGLLFVYE